MKNVAFALLLIPFLMSCSSEGTNPKNNLAVVQKYTQAVEALDYSTMESLLDDNYRGLGPSFGDSVSKGQALEYWKYNVEHLYERIKYNRIQSAPVYISDGPNKGDWVSTWAELKITYKTGENVTI